MLDTWVFIRLLEVFAIGNQVVMVSLMEDEYDGYLFVIQTRSLDGGVTEYFWLEDKEKFDAHVLRMKEYANLPKVAKRVAVFEKKRLWTCPTCGGGYGVGFCFTCY